MEKDQTPPATVLVSDVSAFHTAARAAHGVRVDLTLPTGEATDKWLRVQGVDAPAYRRRQGEILREMGPYHDKEDTVSKAALERLGVALVAALVLDWNLPLPCTEDAVIDLFAAAPQIQGLVDRVGARRATFFGLPPFDSSLSPNSSSG